MDSVALPNWGTLEKYRETLSTAAALGMSVNGIPGMTVYNAIIGVDHENILIELGLFPDKVSAQRAIALWVVREMVETGTAMGSMHLSGKSHDWDEKLFSEWLAKATLEEIIDEYFVDHGTDAWEINEVSIAPHAPACPVSIDEAFTGS